MYKPNLRQLTHVLEGEIKVVEVLGTDNVSQLDDVGMHGEGCEEADLAKGSLCVLAVAECVKYFLQRYDAALLSVVGLPDDSICLRRII